MPEKLRIYFVCDIHGSERCFAKVINALKYNIYKAQVAMLSGDLTGKAIVPIVRQDKDKYLARTLKILGSDESLNSQQELEDLKKRIRNAGFYPFVFGSADLEEFERTPSKLESLFTELMSEALRRWVQVAEQQLRESQVRLIMMPGNDDLREADDIIRESDYVCNPEGTVVELGGHEMISTGYSNPTPWKTPRECSEEDLRRRIDEMARNVDSIQDAIFNFHCPPYASTLDTAPLLGENLRPRLTAGGLLQGPVGSTAVKAAIQDYQPLLGLHGHIHDSPSEARIGRTLCLNPGSLYQQGILRGYIVDLEPHRIKFYQKVEG